MVRINECSKCKMMENEKRARHSRNKPELCSLCTFKKYIMNEKISDYPTTQNTLVFGGILLALLAALFLR